MNKHKPSNERQALTILNIAGYDYLLPESADIASCNASMIVEVVCAEDLAEFSVSMWHRDVVSAARLEELRLADKNARQAEVAARAEELAEKAAEGGK
jgi:hypothetical protein